jgi:hypothetical protein
MRSRGQQAGGGGPGTADGSFEGQHGCGSRLAGQAVPGVWGLGGAEVAVDLAGDVALEAADDFLL